MAWCAVPATTKSARSASKVAIGWPATACGSAGSRDTDFHPLFGLLQERRDFDAVVYFTDGAGPWPTDEPSVPVLWALTSTFVFDCPWGMVVRLPAGADA